MPTETETAKVVVYVRLCDGHSDDCRELSFQIPHGISQMDLLDAGFAIDGNSAMRSVVSYTDEDGNYFPLSTLLRKAQIHTVQWLSDRGFQVEFD